MWACPATSTTNGSEDMIRTRSARRFEFLLYDMMQINTEVSTQTFYFSHKRKDTGMHHLLINVITMATINTGDFIVMQLLI